jgi:hypothetical protein
MLIMATCSDHHSIAIVNTAAELGRQMGIRCVSHRFRHEMTAEKLDMKQESEDCPKSADSKAQTNLKSVHRIH